MKLIVAGSREWHCREKVYAELDELKDSITEVLTGMALHWLWEKNPDIGGPDRYAYEWAKANNVPIQPYFADWVKSRGAGFERNLEMAEYGDALLVFWDGVSSGTEDMMNQMKKRKKPVIPHVKNYNNLDALFE